MRILLALLFATIAASDARAQLTPVSGGTFAGGAITAPIFGPTSTCASPTYSYTGATTTGHVAATTPTLSTCVNGTVVATQEIPTGTSSLSNFLNITGTLTSVSATTRAVNFQITGGGSASSSINAMNVDLLAGYTGSASTFGGRFANTSAGTATTGWSASGNLGFNGLALGTTAGHNTGGAFVAQASSTLNIGSHSRAVSSSNSAALNVGAVVMAQNATVNVGGFFGLMSTAPILSSSSALIADNAAVAADIAQFRDNGTVVVSIVDGGNITPSAGVSYALATAAWTRTAPTVTSAGTSPSVPTSNGDAAFTVNVGTGGTATTIVMAMPTKTTGYSCTATNVTATAANRADQAVRQTASTTTSVTVQNQTVSTGAALAFTASDIVVFHCTGY